MWETRIQFLGSEDSLEKEMTTHSSILAWKISWMEEPGRLQSMGLQRVRHDWATSLLHFEQGAPNLFILLPDYLKWSWYNNNRNKVHNKCNVLAAAAAAKLLQLCPSLCDPMDCSLPSSSVHRIFQARVLERGAIAFSVMCLNHPQTAPTPVHGNCLLQKLSLVPKRLQMIALEDCHA